MPATVLPGYSAHHRPETAKHIAFQVHGAPDMAQSGSVKEHLSRILNELEIPECGIIQRSDAGLQRHFYGLGVSCEQVFGVRESLEAGELMEAMSRAVEIQSKTEWLDKLQVTRALAELLPSGDDRSALSGVRAMSPTELEVMARKLCPLLVEGIEVLRSEHVRDSTEAASSNNKFAFDAEGLGEARFASIDDFYAGIEEVLGLPHLQVDKAVENEHCSSDDSHDEFAPPNYNSGSTTPSQEFRIATRAEDAAAASVGRRRVLLPESILEMDSAKRAGLLRVEALALSLYTGPMYMRYNAVLRGRDSAALKGNKYTATIYAIVSGVMKISRVSAVPPGQKVWRGFGDWRLPVSFLSEDQNGIRGGAEWGLMSTTTDIGTALQYSGTQIPTLFEMSVGGVDRGADISFLSQYPLEKEILYAPLAFLEVVGRPLVKTFEGRRGPVRVLRLKLSANQATLTIDKLLVRRKLMHASMLRFLLAETKRELATLQSSPAFAARAAADPYGHAAELITAVQFECEEAAARQQAAGPETLNDDQSFRRALSSALELMPQAVEKVRFWMEHANIYARDLIRERMADVWRVALGQLHLRLRLAASPHDARALARDVCRSRGWVSGEVEERSHQGETALMQLCALGDAWGARMLVQAGADVNAPRAGDGVTPMMLAAAGGMRECLHVLMEAGASVHAIDATECGFQAMHFAAVNGHAEAIRALGRGGARVGGRDRQGRTALHWAGERGHGAAIDALVEAGAEVDAVNQWGYTPLHRAAYEGHAGAVRRLVAARAAVGAEDENGRTPLHKAAQRGREEVCALLVEARADAGACDEEGETALELAVQAGCAGTLRSLLLAS